MAEDTPPPHTPEPPARDTSLKVPEALVWGGFLGIAAVGLVTLTASGAEIWTRDYWGGNRSEILRNIGLLVLAVPALWLAWRRTNTASRQADIANENKETANRQQRVAERGMNVDRYQKGAQMLESAELSVRIAGIYGLRELAISDPEESYIIVQSLLCAFIREKSNIRAPRPAEDETEGASKEPAAFEDLSPDALEALDATIALRKAIPEVHHLEKKAQWSPSLARANLPCASLFDANLSDANLDDSNLASANLLGANLSGASLCNANLSRANLGKTNMSGAKLAEANLSGADLRSTVLSRADLFYANLSDADLRFAVLSRADLFYANLASANLVNANLSGADLKGTHLPDAGLGRANLSGATLSYANLSGAYLGYANLANARLFDANLSRANLREANLSGANLRAANLSSARFSEAKLDDADISGIWAWADRPPKGIPPEIEAVITYRDPAARKDDD